MSAKESFYVRLLKKDGEQSGYQISVDNEFEDPGIDETVDSDERESEKFAKLRSIHDDFSKSVFGYIDILPIIAAFIPIVATHNQKKRMAEFLDENSSNKKETSDFDSYTVPFSHYWELISLIEDHQTSQHVGRQVPKMLTIGIVSSLEYHMVRLMREILKCNPHVIENSEKEITVRDVFTAGGAEEFKEKLIEREIEGVMRSKFSEQIKWIEKHLKIQKSISADYGRWDELIEVVERRNLFTHVNGVVNDRYMTNTANLKFDGKENVEIGQELRAGPSYFPNVIEIVSEFGIKLAQVVWRKLYPESSMEADDVIGDFGFDLIQRGQYGLACRILNFASVELSGAKRPRRALMDKINLANCLKLDDRSKESKELLDEEDWSSKSNEFLICSLAVEGDAKAVAAKMPIMLHAEEWSEENYETWPVFYHVRDDNQVKEVFRELYGRELVPQIKNKNVLVFPDDDKVKKRRVVKTRRRKLTVSSGDS